MNQPRNRSVRLLRGALVVTCMLAPRIALAQESEAKRCLAAYTAGRYTEAFPLCQQAAAMGHAEAKKGLGIMYFFGRGVPKNYPEAVKYLTPFTHTDRLIAYYMADMYEDGKGGLQKSQETARVLFIESCQKGFPYACKAAAYMYEFGRGVPRDRRTAIQYLSHGGTIGDAYAGQVAKVLARPGTPVFRDEEELGTYVGKVIGPDVVNGDEPDSHVPTTVPGGKLPPPRHDTGPAAGGSQSAEGLWQGCRQKYLNMDHSGAVPLCRKAAEAGSAMAMYQMGYFYKNGDGVTANPAESVKWWRMAADQDNAMALNALGTASELGNGLAQNWVMAASYWQKAAAKGLAGAEYNLARAYRFGIGLPCNLETAVVWYEKSVSHHGNGKDEANWLRGNRFRFDGQFINKEEAAVFNGVWQGNMNVPVGQVFHNSSERMGYLQSQAGNTRAINADGRARDYGRKKRDYDSCVQQNGRDSCGSAPIRPPQ